MAMFPSMVDAPNGRLWFCIIVPVRVPYWHSAPCASPDNAVGALSQHYEKYGRGLNVCCRINVPAELDLVDQ